MAKFRRIPALLILSLYLASCTRLGGEATKTPEIPTPTPLPVEEPHSVFVICWDGGGADLVYDLMGDGSLPNFAALAARGVHAEYALSVDPTLTASAMNTIATGAYPARTGIVSNAYHNPSDSFYWYRRGLDERLDQAEPLWVTASRSGLKTAAVFFAGGSPALPGQTADYTIGYGVRDAYSNRVRVALSPLGDPWRGEASPSFSPPYEGSFTIPRVARLFLYVLDSSDDSTSNYDTVLLNTSRSLNANSLRLKAGEWGPLVLVPANVSGADFLIQEIVQSRGPQYVRLYYSTVYHNTAAPRGLLEALNEKFGFFHAGPDAYAMEHGWITPEDNLVLLERYAAWMAEVAAWVYTTYQPDLLFTWQDGFDSAGHAYLLVDSRQAGYSPEKAESYAGYFRRAVQIADQALATMVKPIDLDRTTVMLVSDHGMAPIHTTVYVNTVLEQAGLLVLDNRNYVVVDESKALAVASGGAVNVYINLKGHERNGIVNRYEYPQVQAQIVDLLASLTDPETGQRVFQRVLRQDELAGLHLDHPNSGDVFAQANPGYSLDGWRGNDLIFEPADYYGGHGYDSALPEMHALFIAAGHGIPPSEEPIPPVRLVDLAPTIASWLGFDPALSAQGAPIPALAADP
jgi:predicted AlkP superfamily phosphohydrolase/phosphomutase